MKTLISTLILVLIANWLFAQTLYTRTDTISITNEFITLQSGNYHGEINWQYSNDSINWNDLATQNKQSLQLSKYDEGTYRAEIIDGTCNPVYSDTATM